ncbi:hypothetical protein BD311DRAFT_750765 [Dichomitus squalens]|uniref:Uncharacterized protein n=1 Tax=Dichomitus squalens TaxID=114155 RepID=A0A4Q9MY35_9APHY|nr:hypothetical protein BD311DRAFT_750765 [Dichomitus squalens]
MKWWWARVLDAVPPVVLSSMWTIAASPVGIWPSRYCPNKDMGMRIWNTIIVSIVARGSVTVWDVAVR